MILTFSLERWSDTERSWKDWGILDIDKKPRKFVKDSDYCNSLRSYLTMTGAPSTYYRVAKSSSIGIFFFDKAAGKVRPATFTDREEAGLS